MLGQSSATTAAPSQFNLLSPPQPAETTSPGIARRIADQSLWTHIDPITGEVTKTTIGQVAAGIGRAVAQPFGDIKALGEYMLATAHESAAESRAHSEAIQNFQTPAPPSSLTPEQLLRAARAKALIGSAMIAGPAGAAVKTIGARALLNSSIVKTAPRLAAGLINLGTGAAEGAAAGASYGAFKPLEDGEADRTQVVTNNAIGGLILGTLFGGVSAYRYLKGGKNMSAEQAAALVEGLQKATREEAALTMATKQQRALLAPEAATGDELAAQVAAGVTEQGASKSGLLGRIINSAGSAADALVYRFPKLKEMDQDLWASALNAADAQTGGAYFARRAAQYVKGPALKKDEEELLIKALYAARGRGIKTGLLKQAAELEPGATVKIGSKLYDATGLQQLAAVVAIPELTAMEQFKYSTAPNIVQAVKRYNSDILPLITDIRQRNGLKTLADVDEPFLPLQRATEADKQAGLKTLSFGPTGGFKQTFATKTTPGAQRALGQGEYIADFEEILRRTMTRDMAADRKNEFMARIINSPHTRRLKAGEAPPATILINGKETPTAVIELTGNPAVMSERFATLVPDAENASGAIGLEELHPEGPVPGEIVAPKLGKYVVPRPVATAFNDLFNPLNRRSDKLNLVDADLNAYHKFMDFNTSLLLASPVEVTAHSSRILGDVARVPGIGDDVSALQMLANKLVPWFGPRLGGLRSFYSIYDNPEAIRMEGRLARIAGALPSRAFEAEHNSALTALFDRAGASPVSKAIGSGRKFIFDLPDIEHGLHGFDIRARITLAMAGEKMAGRAFTDAEMLQWLTQTGSYTDAIQSNLASWLRRSRLYPFSANYGAIAAEIKGFLGGTNLPASVRNDLSKAAINKLRAETLWNGTIGTAVMLLATQKALTDTFPFENEQGHELDLMVGYTQDGHGIYIPMSTLAPGLYRAATITGARAAMETMGEDFIPEVTKQLANTAITYSTGGPGTKALFTLATGSAPYITDQGSILQTVPIQPPSPMGWRTMKERFLTGAGASNPTLENFLGVGPISATMPGAVRVINTITPGLEVGQKPLRRVSAELRGDMAKLYEVVDERVKRANNELGSVAERVSFYKEESAKFPVEQRAQAFIAMLKAEQQYQRSMYGNAAKALINR